MKTFFIVLSLLVITQAAVRRRRQGQNCVGSKCNAYSMEFIFPGFGGFGPAIGLGGGGTQNCHGSKCNQNNGGFGSGGIQNCHGSQCNQNNG